MPCARWKRRHVLPASTAKGCASRGLLLTALAKLNEASCCQDGRQLGRLSVVCVLCVWAPISLGACNALQAPSLHGKELVAKSSSIART